MKRKKAGPVFKPYITGQPSLLPPDLEDMIPENHLVRVVNSTVDKIDLSILLARYKGGGTSSYHPKMMLKVLVYAYAEGIYSSRKIAKGIRENINFMWISGQSRPDFRTLNRFRGEVMKGIIQEVFAEVVEILIETGHVKMEDYFIDGTIVEANARKYSAVWRKNTERYKKQLKKRVESVLEEIEAENEAEAQHYGDKDLEEVGEEVEIDSEMIKEKIKALNKRLKKKSEDKNTKKAVRKLGTDILPKMEKYEEQERLMGDRNSYSKTDTDATFMRMKEDRNKAEAWPKPAYNVQIGTEGQFIIGFSVHQRTADTRCFKEHMEQLKKYLNDLPKRVIGDAGYGSEENYIYMEDEGLENYLKYIGFDKEQTSRYKKDPFQTGNLLYDEEKDAFQCPNGKSLSHQKTQPAPTENNPDRVLDLYECEDCGQCTDKPKCTRAKRNRQIRINWHWQELRAGARERLLSCQGQKLRSRRGVDVEAVFGHIKQDRGFRRFMLRGIEKVTTEWGLISLGHNMKKLSAQC
jgi:transposase